MPTNDEVRIVSADFEDVVARVRTQYPHLSCTVTSDWPKTWAVIHGPLFLREGLDMPLHNPRMLVTDETEITLQTHNLSYQFQINLLTHSCGQLPDKNEEFFQLLDTLHSSSGYTICNGLPKDVCSEIQFFNTRNARAWGIPFGRVDHKDCLMWFRPQSQSRFVRSVRCGNCSKLLHYLRALIRKRKIAAVEQRSTQTSVIQ